MPVALRNVRFWGFPTPSLKLLASAFTPVPPFDGLPNGFTGYPTDDEAGSRNDGEDGEGGKRSKARAVETSEGTKARGAAAETSSRLPLRADIHGPIRSHLDTRNGNQRSISPNTMSREPSIAGTSASMCPRVKKSIAAKCGYDGARILHLYGWLVPSETR